MPSTHWIMPDHSPISQYNLVITENFYWVMPDNNSIWIWSGSNTNIYWIMPDHILISLWSVNDSKFLENHARSQPHVNMIWHQHQILIESCQITSRYRYDLAPNHMVIDSCQIIAWSQCYLAPTPNIYWIMPDHNQSDQQNTYTSY